MGQPTFQWIPVYKVIAEEIHKRNTPRGREELLDICAECLGKDDWEYVDPLAIFLAFNRSGKNNNLQRAKQIRSLMKAFEIELPFDDDLSGIPTTYQRFGIIAHNADDAEKSWDLFGLILNGDDQILENESFLEMMDQVAAFNGNRHFNDLTKILYMINPRVFFPLHHSNNDLVRDRYGVDCRIIHHSAKGYAEFIKQLKDAPAEKFWLLSNSADPHLGNGINAQIDPESPSASRAPQGRNIILYGPPGTGKTYSVPAAAWLIANGKECSLDSLRDLSPEDHEAAKQWYNAQLQKPDGQIAFTTFHQSYGYEEFIEGIRPVIAEESPESDGSLSYCHEDGIFKSFCKRASQPIVLGGAERLGLNSNPTVWKVSLDGTGPNPIRADCLENGHIRIGWDEYGPVITDGIDYKHGGKGILNYFTNVMRSGDIVLSCYSATTVDAIGVITGDAEWHEEYDRLKRQREVNWLVKDLSLNIVEQFNAPTMTLSTIYRSKVSAGDILKVVERESGGEIASPNDNSYIFVIDEINRGNISKIFGELITLIEESKRAGLADEQRAVLPYTKEVLSVPANVTILGTMNLADRSLTQLDAALRRRFKFIELAPNPSAIKPQNIESTEGPINLSSILSAMNARIAALYDQDHLIGHSYFIGTKTFKDLRQRFSQNILPLLQEYFYDDYDKIRLVLNDSSDAEGFIVKRQIEGKYLGNLGNVAAPLMVSDSAQWEPRHFMAIYEETPLKVRPTSVKQG